MNSSFLTLILCLLLFSSLGGEAAAVDASNEPPVHPILQGDPWSVPASCEVAHVSKYHFIRLFKSYYGQTPHYRFFSRHQQPAPMLHPGALLVVGWKGGGMDGLKGGWIFFLPTIPPSV